MLTEKFRHFHSVILAVAFAALYAGAQEPAEDVALEVQTDVSLLKQQAEAGDAEAMNYLGYLFLSGEEGVERDAASGLSWLVKAASMGDAKAASNIGWLMIEGDLVEQNFEQGAQWLEKASAKGLPIAQSLLGDLYRDGKGVPQDSFTADSLYRSAFEHGLTDAGHKLFSLHEAEYTALSPAEKVDVGRYFYLRGVPSEGVKLFYMASDEGDSDAMALLGDAYSRAIGVPYDYDLSLKYFTQAAVAGNPSAQFIIGELLEIFPDALQGLDMEDDLADDPAYWYGKALDAGVGDADQAFDRLMGL